MNKNTNTHRHNLFTIASGKGGVGKTSVTLNLATLLARQGKKVLLLDGDTGLANLDVQLNITPKFDLTEVFTGRKPLADIATETPYGFKLLAGRAGHTGLANLPLPVISKLLTEVRSLTPHYDAIFIDAAAGVDNQTLTLCAGSDTTLLVTTPDPSAITDAYALIKLLWKDHGIANTRLIVNQASTRESTEVHKKLSHAAEHFLGLPELNLLGHIPLCRQYASAVRMHQLAAVAYPNSTAITALAGIIKHIVQ